MALFCANSDFEFVKVRDKLVALINFCQLDFDLAVVCKFSNYAISLSCVFIALEQLNWHQFLSEFRSYIKDTNSGLSFLLQNDKIDT